MLFKYCWQPNTGCSTFNIASQHSTLHYGNWRKMCGYQKYMAIIWLQVISKGRTKDNAQVSTFGTGGQTKWNRWPSETIQAWIYSVCRNYMTNKWNTCIWKHGTRTRVRSTTIFRQEKKKGGVGGRCCVRTRQTLRKVKNTKKLHYKSQRGTPSCNVQHDDWSEISGEGKK